MGLPLLVCMKLFLKDTISQAQHIGVETEFNVQLRSFKVFWDQRNPTRDSICSIIIGLIYKVSNDIASESNGHLGNANPDGIFQTRVYGFDGLQTRVPLIMSVRRAAGSYCSVGLQLVVCLVFTQNFIRH